MHGRIASRTLLVLAGIGGFAMTGTSIAQQPPVIPMKDFFRNPEKVCFQLSPNGEYLAFLAPWQSRLNVHVQKIGEEKVTRITEATERDIMGYAWKGNGRIVYVQDTGGDEN